MGLLDEIEQGIVDSAIRKVLQPYADAGDLAPDDLEKVVAAGWPLISLALTLYGRAAAQGAT